MSIKSQGGVFGRNPTFNDVTVDGDLSIAGTLSIGGETITGLSYQGGWNADTNTPDIAASSPVTGQFWIVSTDGSTDVGGITNWTSGDWALYDGTNWQRVEGGNTDLTTGVSGQLAISNGGTGAADAATARTNLGLGTAATTAATDYATAAQGTTADSALQPADIGSTVQGYDADTAKYDDTTANFTGTLQNGGSNVVVDSDIGSTVQAYDADTAKLDAAQSWTAKQTFGSGADIQSTGETVFERLSSNGGIVLLKKDNVEVGRFGVTGSRMYIGTVYGNDSFIRFDDSSIRPATSGGVDRDGAIDLGASGARFKKLYLSDNLVVASGKGIDFSATSGTGTSELLDDYEEGTWTPVYKGTTTDPVVTYQDTYGRYTKIGNMVFVQGKIGIASLTSVGSGIMQIGGLPFTVKSGQNSAITLAANNDWGSNNFPTHATAVGGGTVFTLLKSASNPQAELETVDASGMLSGGNDNLTIFSGFYEVQ